MTEENLRETFERCTASHTFHVLDGFWSRWNCSIRRFGRVERVKKIKDYAFVHFEERIQAVEGEKEHDMKVCSTLWVCGRWKMSMMWQYIQPSGFEQQRNRQRSCFFRFCFFPIMPKTISCGSLRAAIYSSAVNFIGVRLVPPLTFSTFKRHSQQTNTFSTNIPRKIWGCDIGCCLIISIAAMNALNGQDLQGARLEISLAKVFDH